MNNKKTITPYNDKKQPHGYWKRYTFYGNIWFKCIYNNGKRIGYEIDYNYNGEIIIKRYNI